MADCHEMPDWTARPQPAGDTLVGRHCRLDRLQVERDAASLFEAYAPASDTGDRDYLPYGPFPTLEALSAWLSKVSAGSDPLVYVIRESADEGSTGAALGILAFMRIDAPSGVIEIGHIHFSRRLQRTTAATEAIFLLLAHAFDNLGYRRIEWKCDAAHIRSRRAAERFGFRYEGTFRQHRVVKGRNRDTAWFAMLDGDWPAIKAEFQRWLEPSNFDAAGHQLTALRSLG